jgi:predicted phage tail protein
MKTVIVTALTAVSQMAAGTQPAGILFSIPGQPSQTVTAAPYSASFANVPAGTYQATAQAVDVSGNPLGAPATSSSFDVSADTVGVDIPVSITISVQ